MEQYIPKSAVVAEIERLFERAGNSLGEYRNGAEHTLISINDFLDTLEVKEGKQIIIITESDGDAHIHWDCRSLEDVNTLLDCAKSFIIDRQIEDVRGKGSFPDYNTEEGRYKDLFSKSSEVKEVDLEKELDNYISNNFFGSQTMGFFANRTKEEPNDQDIALCARHFFELGLQARIDKELVEEVYSHLDSIKDTTDRMTSGNFMHNRAAIKFSANTIAKVLELIGLKAQKGEES